MNKNEEKKNITYEQAAAELESVVELLESGELTLEDSIRRFEKGIELIRFCNKKLDDIEKRITILIEGKDGMIEKDYHPDDMQI
jgi:exodeoxyribonuclease VII small subunit